MDNVGDGPILPRVLGSFGSLKGVKYNEECFLNGHAFSYIDYLIYGSSEVKDFVIDPRAFVNPPNGYNRVMSEVPVFNATAGPITIQVYGDTQAADDGTLINLYNRDGRSSKPIADTIIRLNPTITSPGINFANYLVPATGVSPATGAPASVGDVLPFNLRLDQKYLFRITNTNGNGVYVGVRSIIYEC
jgi:hypothetical protein